MQIFLAAALLCAVIGTIMLISNCVEVISRSILLSSDKIRVNHIGVALGYKPVLWFLPTIVYIAINS